MRSGWKLSGRAGADRALADLYRLHYRSLVRLATLLVADLVTAESIVQDAFVDLCAAWPARQAHWPGLHAAWPGSYARRPGVVGDRAALAFLRQRVVELCRPVPADGAPGHSALVAALQSLTARQREVLVLQYFADLPEAQVAEVAGISEAAVGRQVMLALSALRAELPSGK